MFVIGLTGGIATGKSTVAHFFAYHGIPIINSDETAHHLLTQPLVIEHISKFAPKAIENNVINRTKLGEIVFTNDEKLNKLENLLHPLIQQSEQEIIHSMQCLGKNIILLDIPLLFETRDTVEFDMTITTSCPERVQISRAMARNGMTKTKLEAIMARQIATIDKEAMADATLSTGLNKAHTMRQVKQLLSEI